MHAIHSRSSLALLALLACLASCKEEKEPGPSGEDAGLDAGQEPSGDGGVEAGMDAGFMKDATPSDDDSGEHDFDSGEVEPEECDDDGDGYRAVQCGGNDCDDTNAAVSPTALEVCNNGVDDDCNPGTGDLADNDFDRVRCDADCNDHDPNVSPNRVEVCGNGIDDDCNPATPDVFDADADGDACNVDCDDSDPTIGPSRAELCVNGVDDDCDSSTVDRFDLDGDGVPCDVDCSDSDSSVPNATGSCGGVLEYYEGFETSLGGWTPDAAGTWRRAIPSGDELTTAASGQYVLIASGPNGEYPDHEYATVTSAAFDMSVLTADPLLSFKTRRYLWSNDFVWLEMSVDGGLSWQSVGSSAVASSWYNAQSNTYWGGDQPEWATAQTLLTGAAGHADVRLRFVISTNAFDGDDGFAIDELRIRGELTNAAVTFVQGAAPGCGVRDAMALSIEVANLGNRPLTDVPVAYAIDGGAPVVESIPGPIAVGSVLTHHFVTPADLSAIGAHSVKAWVELAGDQDRSDDSATVTTRTFPIVPLDYNESFEATDGGWTVSGIEPSWERGQPTDDQFTSASDGLWAWVTNADGVVDDDEDSYLTSPCFDLQGLSVDPVLLLDFNLASSGYLTIEQSTDAGASFSVLGSTTSGSGWYNNANGWSYASSSFMLPRPWRAAIHPFTSAAGTVMQFRVHFNAGDFEAGAAIDDVHVVASFIDAEVVSVELPALACDDQTAVAPRVVVRNNGNYALPSYKVRYSLDGGAAVEETVSIPLAPGQTYTHTFATPLDLSAPGEHAVDLRVVATGDMLAENDAKLQSVITRERVSGVDYVEGFEQDDGDWLAMGLAGQWQWGTPAGPQLDVITEAGEGEKLWTTRLYGQFLTRGVATLVSPCLDFSAYTSQPSLRFLHVNDTDASSSDWAAVETSVDGTNWTRVGTNASGGQNWYNASFGASGHGWRGTWGWRIAQHVLTGTQGQPHVFVRFVFNASNSSNASRDGTGVDQVLIGENFIDVAVQNVQTTGAGCDGLRSAEAFSVDVVNNSTAAVSSFVLAYSVDDGAEQQEPVTQTIAPGATYTHDFASTLDLNGGGPHTIQVRISVTGIDIDATNNVASVVTTTLQTFTLPYSETFEAGSGGWATGGNLPTWQHGTPSGTAISAANSMGKVWATNLAGDYVTHEQSFLQSPCFDLSSAVAEPTLSFRMNHVIESSYDGAWVELSLDGGASWAKLGSSADSGWYNRGDPLQRWDGSSSGWVTRSHALTGAAGHSAVTLRVRLSSDDSVTREGVGIDNVSLMP